jgi:cytoskeletal protein RodZ
VIAVIWRFLTFTLHSSTYIGEVHHMRVGGETGAGSRRDRLAPPIKRRQKKMKKYLAVVLVVAVVAIFAVFAVGCGRDETTTTSAAESTTSSAFERTDTSLEDTTDTSLEETTTTGY